MSMKPSQHFGLRLSGRTILVLMGLCIFGSLSSTSQTPQPPIETSPTASPTTRRDSESTKNDESNQTKASQWAIDAAAFAGGTWPWGIIILAIVLLIWLRKDIKALFTRFSANASSVKVAGVELQMQYPHENKELSSQIDGEAENPPNVPTEIQKLELEAQGNFELKAEAQLPVSDSENLFGQMVDAATKGGNLVELEALYKKIHSKEDEKEKPEDSAFYFYLRFRAGDANAIQELEELTQRGADKSVVYKWLAFCYEVATKFDKAIETYEKAITTAPDNASKARIIVSLTGLQYKTQNKENAVARVITEINSISDRVALSLLYEGLAELYQKDGNTTFQTLALEKAIEFADENKSLLFDLAYAYGENEQRELSWHTYQTLLVLNPNHSTALNNLGVVYNELKMPISAVSVYRKAADRGNTLASANLAYKLVDAGFENEAKQILEEARKQEIVHQNVVKAESDILTRKENEASKKNEITVHGERQRSFLRAWGTAYFSENKTPINLDGKWIFNFRNAGTAGEIKQSGKDMEAFWSNETKKLTGVIHNKSIVIAMYKSEYSYSASKNILVPGMNAKAYLTDNGSRIFVMMDEGDSHQFWEIIRDENGKPITNE